MLISGQISGSCDAGRRRTRSCYVFLNEKKIANKKVLISIENVSLYPTPWLYGPLGTISVIFLCLIIVV
jgi:hypothetical protein